MLLIDISITFGAIEIPREIKDFLEEFSAEKRLICLLDLIKVSLFLSSHFVGNGRSHTCQLVKALIVKKCKARISILDRMLIGSRSKSYFKLMVYNISLYYTQIQLTTFMHRQNMCIKTSVHSSICTHG